MSLKFAPIVPIKYNPADITDYHLILAHQVVGNNEYKDYYCSLGIDHTIILDNSVIELGIVDLSLVSEAVAILAQSNFRGRLIVVAPDCLRSSEETFHLHREFLENPFIKRGVQDKIFEVMYVPQGQDSEEWSHCLVDLLNLKVESPWIGIPRLTEDFEGGRKHLYKECQNLLKGLNIHLLGIQHNINEVKWAQKVPQIIGVDSSLPLRAASNGLAVTEIDDLRKVPDNDFYDFRNHAMVRACISTCCSYLTY